jgi:hypothetical protein
MKDGQHSYGDLCYVSSDVSIWNAIDIDTSLDTQISIDVLTIFYYAKHFLQILKHILYFFQLLSFIFLGATQKTAIFILKTSCPAGNTNARRVAPGTLCHHLLDVTTVWQIHLLLFSVFLPVE